MQLWMIAQEALWTRLQAEGELLCNPARIPPDYDPAYSWLRQACARRMNHYMGHHLWWAWVRWLPGRPRPDLRSRRFHWFAPGTPAVRLELDVPDEQVLCTNYNLWEEVLFEHSIARPTDVDAATPRGMGSVGSMGSVGDKGQPDPSEDPRAAMEASWEAIFDVPSCDAGAFDAASARVPTVQAVFEVLRRDQVVRVTPFRSRPLRNRFRSSHRDGV